MKSLKVKNILDKGAESKMDEQRKQEIDTIQEALDEKRIREIQNLELRLEKDRLCAEMANVDAINNILNSTSQNEIGCPMNGDVKKKIEHKYTCQSVTCHPVEEVVVQEVQHGEGCHCEKCCPNPKKNWFQRNKRGLSIGANGGNNNNRLPASPVTGQEYEIVISEQKDNNVRWFVNGNLVQNGTSTRHNPLYLSNTESPNRFIGSYSLIEIYNGYCNTYTEFTNMINSRNV